MVDRGAVQYRGNVLSMAIVHSRITAQGQISVPAAIRQKLGVGPGSTLEWDEASKAPDPGRTKGWAKGPRETAPCAPLTPTSSYVLEAARKAGHLALGTFDRDLAKPEGVQRL
jgi:AbrB family looped-hinge helix DNA binding protein